MSCVLLNLRSRLCSDVWCGGMENDKVSVAQWTDLLRRRRMAEDIGSQFSV